MGQTVPAVLLLGDAPSAAAVRSFLTTRGWECHLAGSLSERSRARSYSLILNTKLGKIAHSSLPELQNEARDIFSALPVENGCWWLPVVRNGRLCLGCPALRSREFGDVLEAILQEAVAHGTREKPARDRMTEALLDARPLAVTAGR